jgi:hypothetical protein
MLSGSDTALTIATGVVTLTNNSSSYVIDTEGSTSTDDLDTINGGQDGQIIFIKSTADARNIVLKHNTGNIWNPQNNNATTRDITLDVTTDFAILRYSSTASKWVIISTSFNNFQNSKTASGYTYLPNGLIIQWGSNTFNNTVTFPIAFPTVNLSTVITLGSSGAVRIVSINNPVLSGFGSQSWDITGSSIAGSLFYWTAIGY